MKNCRARFFLHVVAVLSILSCRSWIFAQETAPVHPKVERPAYNIVPFEEDWSYLRDRSQRADWLDGIKYIHFGQNENAFISLGGEFRGTYERLGNDNWSSQPVAANSFGLQRFLLHADTHFNRHLRLFLELQSGLEQGRPLGPRPIDEKKLDFLNAFLELRPYDFSQTVTLRVGKQELQLGSGRLISVREGPNVRQSFYGFRVDQPIRKWNLTGGQQWTASASLTVHLKAQRSFGGRLVPGTGSASTRCH